LSDVSRRAAADNALSHVCVSVCVFISYKQDMVNTNLWIFAKLIAYAFYIILWK